MKKNILILFGLLPIALIANNQGIEKLNYSVSTNLSQSDYSEDIGVGASIRIPLVKYIGMEFNTNLSSSNGKDSYVDSENKSAGISLIL